MDKINLLFFTRDYSKHVFRNIHYLSEALSEVTNLVVWSDPGDIKDILKQINFTPDFILINDKAPENSPIITGLSSINIPLGMIIIDLHTCVNEQKKFINENNIKYIFSCYRDAFKTFYPEYIDRMFWIPHLVNIDVFKDYKLKKDIDYLLMGATYEHLYPLRVKIIKIMKSEPGFLYHPHPGYKFSAETNDYVGEKYAREINRAKIFITEDSIYHYPLSKYYEVLACNTLLLATASKELEDLGFIPGENFVAINEDNFVSEARYYLSHEKEREEIARKGYEMVKQRHSAQKRALEFVNILQYIL